MTPADMDGPWPLPGDHFPDAWKMVTGHPPGLLQDDSRDLSRWLASKPGAKSLADEAAQRIQILDPEPAGTPETIWWRDAEADKPDAELTVLLETTDPDMPIAQGWWDGERWCLCESGGFAPEGSVLAWAVVSGRANVEAERLP